MSLLTYRIAVITVVVGFAMARSIPNVNNESGTGKPTQLGCCLQSTSDVFWSITSSRGWSIIQLSKTQRNTIIP